MSQENAFSVVEAGVKKPNGKFIRNLIMHIDEVDDFRAKWNNTGVYTTAYVYDTEDIPQANLLGDLYLDFDISNLDNENFELIRQDAIRTCAMFHAIFDLGYDEFRIYFSGKKGIHIVVPALSLGIEARPDLNEVFRVIAMDIQNVLKHKTLDTKIYDRVRLFRLPNSIHPDTGLFKVPLTYEELRECSYDEIEELARRPRKIQGKQPRYNAKASKVYRSFVEKKEKETKEFNRKKGERKLDFMPPCVKAILHQEAPDGQRNNTCAALASYFKRRGNSEELAYEKLCRWNEKRCSPMLKDSEIQTTVRSIYRGEYNYGCRTLEPLGGCSQECKMYRRK